MKWRAFLVACVLVVFLGFCSERFSAEDFCSAGGKDREPIAGTDEFVRRALSKPVSIEVIDKPLDEVVEALAKQANVMATIHYRSLYAVRLDPDALPIVTATFHELPLRSCLRVILNELELTYMVDKGMLMITTPEHNEQHLATAVFDVSDLLGIDDKTPFHMADYDTLIELITTTIAPTTWDEVGGPGSVYGFRGTLPIPQTEEVLDQICELLAAIREAEQVTAKHGDSPPPVTSISATGPREAVNRVHKALDAKADFEFIDTPLGEAVAILQRKYGVPVRIKESALDAVGLGPDTKYTFSARNDLTLRRALNRWLDELELTYIVYEGVLFITTPEDAEQNLTVRVYPVQDLVEQAPWSSVRWSLYNDSDESSYMDYDELIDLTTVTTQQIGWNYSGGPGSISEMSAYGLLVISQTQRMHQKIESIYSKLRKTIPAAAKKPLEEPADDELRMAVYSVPRTYTGLTAEECNNPSEREVLNLITSIIEPQTWRKRGDVYAHSIKDRLIIRHTNAVHRQIYQLATKLEIMGFREMGVSHGNSFFSCVVPVVGDKQLPPPVQNDPIRR